ncbi:hypothetical protein [Burkholderia gladioli]|nr:hypothetical protein [Burkholderia gladioli]
MNDFAWIALFLVVAFVLARVGFEAAQTAANVFPAFPTSQASAPSAK